MEWKICYTEFKISLRGFCEVVCKNYRRDRVNIILTGMMGSGKTEIGKILAKKLKMNFIDMDENIEKTTGKKISEIFKYAGESHFRHLERNLVKCLAFLDGFVISTGGGIVLNKDNIRDFRKNGIVFYLKAKPEALYERIKHTKNRPLLNVEDPLGELKRIYKKRKKLYENCDFAIITEGKTKEQICNEIIERFKNAQSGNRTKLKNR
ncbi:MAG: shikimate kinase [Elusimicrobia bacterium]|nr:shikimate kinase [Elusimicrobiota bacterium]